MREINQVSKGSITYALLCKKPSTDAVRFLTPREDEFQLGVIERPAGHVVAPHSHPVSAKTVRGVSEFLYVETGRIDVTVFDEEWLQLAQDTLEAGDFLVFFRGGHALKFLEASRLIEVKQGPDTGIVPSKVYRDRA